MKKILLRILLVLVIVIVVVVGGGFLYLKYALPSIDAPQELVVEATPARLERGEYLANHVALCIDCHSVRDWSKFSAPPLPGTEGGGGDEFTREMGLPGHYIAPNITPYGIGDWTDGELYRAITSGVSKDGKALFPMMPYLLYGQMDKEDIYSIIAYIRTLEPIEEEWPDSETDFPMSLIMNTIPTEPVHQPIPDPSNKVAYGKYLSKACFECHTPFEKGQLVTEQAYTGGREFPLPTGGIVYSANLTPHETGLGSWSEEMFIQRFKMYQDSSYVLPHVGKNEFNTVMPWEMMSGTTEEDLSAIYAFLKTLEPVEKTVVKFKPE